MKRIVATLLALGALVLAAPACQPEADCAGACEHQCQVCDTGCDPKALDACVESCVNMETSPSRTSCIKDAPTCDAIWEC